MSNDKPCRHEGTIAWDADGLRCTHCNTLLEPKREQPQGEPTIDPPEYAPNFAFDVTGEPASPPARELTKEEYEFNVDFFWCGNYWFVWPALSISFSETDWNIALGWFKGEIRFTFLRK